MKSVCGHGDSSVAVIGDVMVVQDNVLDGQNISYQANQFQMILDRPFKFEEQLRDYTYMYELFTVR